MIPIKRTIRRTGLLLVLALALALSGCFAAPRPAAEQARFDDFLHRSFVAAVTVDSITQHTLVKHPEAFGIAPDGLTLPTYDFPSEADITAARESIVELMTFDPAQLTPEQQRDYAVMVYLAGLFEPALDLHHYTDPLMGLDRVHALLPIVLSIAPLTSAADVTMYLELVARSGEIFDSVIRHEVERADRGLFMTDVQTEAILGECEFFLADRTTNVLLTSFEERLGALGLDPAETAALVAQNQHLFDTVVVPAYERLMAQLEDLAGTGADQNRWANPAERRASYALALKYLGTTRTPAQWADRLDAYLPGLLAERYALTQAAKETPDATVIDVMAAEDLLDLWLTRTADEFPALPDGVTASLAPISESLKAIAPPAFYALPRVDDPFVNLIQYDADWAVIDPAYFAGLMAHEGYPGHMLQQTSLRSGSLPLYRQVTGFLAYIEGWAQHAERRAIMSLDADPSLKRLYLLNQEMDVLLFFRLDIGVHFEGWDLAAVTDYLMTVVPNWDEQPDGLAERLFYIAETRPLEAAPYATGLMELTELHQLSVGDSSTPEHHRAFHEAYLGFGPAPFFLLREWMGLPADV